MQTCKGCPNRWLSKLSRAVGEESLADEIEKGGCPSYQLVGEFDPDTQQVKNQRWECMREKVLDHLSAQGSEVSLASKTIQAERNESKEGFGRLERKIENLQGQLQTLCQLSLKAQSERLVASHVIDVLRQAENGEVSYSAPPVFGVAGSAPGRTTDNDGGTHGSTVTDSGHVADTP